MKYKIGDKVKVKSLEWYNKNKSDDGFLFCRSRYFCPDMSTFCGCILTIKSVGYDIYYTEENIFAWNEYMFEGIVDYKENIEITLNDKNYIIDVEKAKELGVIKEKDTRCRSWEEYKLKYNSKEGYCYDSINDEMNNPRNPWGTSEQLTQQEAIAIQAFSKLLKLRRDWIGNWKPDWSNCERKYCIEVCRNEFYVNCITIYSKTFSFPTEKMAREFFDLFKDLFEQCKNLI